MQEMGRSRSRDDGSRGRPTSSDRRSSSPADFERDGLARQRRSSSSADFVRDRQSTIDRRSSSPADSAQDQPRSRNEQLINFFNSSESHGYLQSLPSAAVEAMQPLLKDLLNPTTLREHMHALVEQSKKLALDGSASTEILEAVKKQEVFKGILDETFLHEAEGGTAHVTWEPLRETMNQPTDSHPDQTTGFFRMPEHPNAGFFRQWGISVSYTNTREQERERLDALIAQEVRPSDDMSGIEGHRERIRQFRTMHEKYGEHMSEDMRQESERRLQNLEDPENQSMITDREELADLITRDVRPSVGVSELEGHRERVRQFRTMHEDHKSHMSGDMRQESERRLRSLEDPMNQWMITDKEELADLITRDVRPSDGVSGLEGHRERMHQFRTMLRDHKSRMSGDMSQEGWRRLQSLEDPMNQEMITTREELADLVAREVHPTPNLSGLERRADLIRQMRTLYELHRGRMNEDIQRESERELRGLEDPRNQGMITTREELADLIAREVPYMSNGFGLERHAKRIYQFSMMHQNHEGRMSTTMHQESENHLRSLEDPRNQEMITTREEWGDLINREVRPASDPSEPERQANNMHQLRMLYELHKSRLSEELYQELQNPRN